MPNFDPDKLIDVGPTIINSGPNDRIATTITNDPANDQPVNTELFDKVMSGEKLTAEDMLPVKKETTPPADKPPTAKDTPPSPEDKLRAEEDASLKALEEKQKLADEAEKKAQDKKDETPPKDDTTPKPPPTAKLPEKIDLNNIDFKSLGIPESAVPLLKKMDRQAQEYVLAEFKRRGKEVEEAKASLDLAKKSVRGDIPANWYEHQQAYALMPEYQQAVGVANQLKGYAEHFREQLIALEEGEPWVDLQRNAQGQIVQVPMKTDAAMVSRIKVGLQQKIQQFDIAAQEQERTSNQIAGQFIEQHKNLRADIEKREDEYFPQYKGEEFEKNVDGKHAMAMLASGGQGNNPLARFTAKLYAFAISQIAEVDTLRAKLNGGKSNIPPVNNAGPTGDEIDKGGGDVNGERKYNNMDDVPFDPNKFDAILNKGRG